MWSAWPSKGIRPGAVAGERTALVIGLRPLAESSYVGDIILYLRIAKTIS
jgi:hypothetical protein